MSRPSTSQAPVIGITADLSGVPANGTDAAQEPTLFLPQRYCRDDPRSGWNTSYPPADRFPERVAQDFAASRRRVD